MKLGPLENAPLETECLYGESVEVLKESSYWVYCKLLTDNYFGWIKRNSLGNLKEPTHRIIVERSFIYENDNPKSKPIFYLPMGAKLVIESMVNDWARVIMIKNRIGYIPKDHIIKIDEKVINWVSMAEQLEGTPYKWGGRDTLGIDCSALLQLSYQTYGEIIPRNTSDQVQLKKPHIGSIKNLKRGHVVFWDGHVGIMTDEKNCIHANAFHMKTVTEPISDIINRMNKDQKIVKMMNFN